MLRSGYFSLSQTLKFLLLFSAPLRLCVRKIYGKRLFVYIRCVGWVERSETQQLQDFGVLGFVPQPNLHLLAISLLLKRSNSYSYSLQLCAFA
ncbi:hypothetical protein NIES2098_45660 [Calothrix sp. NIES-2098]|nr:hypothetical protein NIES2098_45660 [Calothrix sp. NIES-2098]